MYGGRHEYVVRLPAKKLHEVMYKAIEECSEVTHAICKARRFGLDNWHPETHLNNGAAIVQECEQAIKALRLLKKQVHKTPVKLLWEDK